MSIERVVVHRGELLGDDRQVLGVDELGGLGRRRREQQVDARIVLDHDLADEVAVDRRRRHDVDDALAIEAEVEEDAVVAELEVAVDQRDLASELAMQRDRRVDRDGRRADPALGAVEREDRARAAAGRAATPSGAKRASRLLIRASSSAGWNGLIR